ncbi:MAG: family 20 glycosylhydrolase [Pseudomonadales bacterium]|nr:family 20 glycosylhydrolase [Pseudomonadales bacterium]
MHIKGAESSQVLAFAEQVLAPTPLGRIEITVLNHCANAAPQLSMNESYGLSVAEDVIALTAHSRWGALRGVTTLAQLACHGQLYVGLEVNDSPRFPWRGLLLDVARHFFPMASLKIVIDGLAAVKMNVLHLHLSDDQGFRFPSAVFPNLASDDHYSADELRELVSYAADRGVRIVPELDMPGHVTSWLVAHPEWGSQHTAASRRFGVHKACLNPLDETVYEAIEVLLSEVADIFPDEYLHVGGDEVNPSWWHSDPAIASYLEREQLSTPDLQNQFLTRVCATVAKLGKKAIGWDEVLHPQMPDCVVQNWRGATSRDRALALSRPVLVSAPYYLDLHYPADVHYGFDPEAAQTQWLAQEDALQQDPRLSHVADGMAWTKHWRKDRVEYKGAVKVLGGEACLWSELVNPDVLAVRLWSRLPAVAERLWSSASCSDSANMYRRLQACWRALPENPEALARHRLLGLGYTEAQLGTITLLEPVKWYGRLLGKAALQARLSGTEMPQARPYHADTPLNRVIDYLPPESMPARRLAELELLEAATRVKALLAAWEDDQFAAGDELKPIHTRLAQGADVIFALHSGGLSVEQALQQMRELAEPQDEYIAAPLIDWCTVLAQQIAAH